MNLPSARLAYPAGFDTESKNKRRSDEGTGTKGRRDEGTKRRRTIQYRDREGADGATGVRSYGEGTVGLSDPDPDVSRQAGTKTHRGRLRDGGTVSVKVPVGEHVWAGTAPVAGFGL